MKIFRKKVNSYHGLLNQGATCYLNSVLQVLFMTREFRQAVHRHTAGLDRHLSELFEDLQRQTACTHKLTGALGIDRVWEQHDVAECFERILTLASPDASQVFLGQLTHKTTCSKCNTDKNMDSQISLLPLSLMHSHNEEYSVVDGVEEYFRDSHFTGQDQMYCDQCDHKVDVIVRCEVKHHPDVLVLLLKRFEFDPRFMRHVKNTRCVKVPLTLQIPKGQTYELYAVVDHAGDLRGGHYTATINVQDDSPKWQWYKFNDDVVTLLGSRPFRAGKSNTAYLLFYKKRQKLSEAQNPAVTIKIKDKNRANKQRTWLLTCFQILKHGKVNWKVDPISILSVRKTQIRNYLHQYTEDVQDRNEQQRAKKVKGREQMIVMHQGENSLKHVTEGADYHHNSKLPHGNITNICIENRGEEEIIKVELKKGKKHGDEEGAGVKPQNKPHDKCQREIKVRG